MEVGFTHQATRPVPARDKARNQLEPALVEAVPDQAGRCRVDRCASPTRPGIDSGSSRFPGRKLLSFKFPLAILSLGIHHRVTVASHPVVNRPVAVSSNVTGLPHKKL